MECFLFETSSKVALAYSNDTIEHSCVIQVSESAETKQFYNSSVSL